MRNGCGSRRTVVKTSSRGNLYLDWEPMPRVPDEFLECVVYLYPSIPAAEAGERVGGTGFIVRVDERGTDFYYVITNKHVIEKGNCTVRFNNTARAHEAYEYDERNWIKARNADLAMYLIPDPDPTRLDLRPVTVGQFITREKIARLDIGIGDEVFFAGRFINAEGTDRNRPSLRFGTIAQVATDVIDGEESFLVEGRSIPGYSGSPVFVYTLAGTPRSVVSSGLPTQGYGPFLLGVDWSHIYDYVDAKDDRGNALQFKIRSNSGMMGVIPVWKLQELLYRQDVLNMRDRLPKKQRAANPDAASRDSASPAQDDDANPNHLADFTRLVDVAARKRPQDDQT